MRPGYLIHHYISGKRQVAFPPVKMLFIVALANALATRLHEKLYGSVAEIQTFEGELAFLNQFMTWAKDNTAWSTLLFMAVFILPTWLFFRRAPRYPRHNLPEGFFIQVFMASLNLLIDTVAQLTVIRASVLFPIYFIVTYRQLFGYGWWGTIWRLLFCAAIGFALILMAAMASVVWFNAEEIFSS